MKTTKPLELSVNEYQLAFFVLAVLFCLVFGHMLYSLTALGTAIALRR